MAEIKIEKKKPIWPWILLAIVLLGIGYFIYTSQENDDYTDDSDANEVENMNGVMDSDSISYDSRTVYGDSSNETRELSEVMKDSARFGVDTTYTNRALADLVERTLKIAKIHNLKSSSAISDLERHTTTTQNPKATNSNYFKTISTDIVEVISAVQVNNAPRLQQKVVELKDTASRINAALDLSKQQSALQAFFRKAHELLNNLNS